MEDKTNPMPIRIHPGGEEVGYVYSYSIWDSGVVDVVIDLRHPMKGIYGRILHDGIFYVENAELWDTMPDKIRNFLKKGWNFTTNVLTEHGIIVTYRTPRGKSLHQEHADIWNK